MGRLQGTGHRAARWASQRQDNHSEQNSEGPLLPEERQQEKGGARGEDDKEQKEKGDSKGGRRDRTSSPEREGTKAPASPVYGPCMDVPSA